MHGTDEASNGGKVKVCIIHGLNISQKNSYTYCKNLEVIKNQALRACVSASSATPSWFWSIDDKVG